MEWQKNFSKMEYYIKYFDKKYLAASPNGIGWDYRKIIAYNKQLGILATQHAESINHISKELLNLFKQLQESETQLNTTTNEIDSMVKNMRILPLSTIFQLFPRMVHNIARDKNKKIDLIIEGADISADKTIIEEIKIVEEAVNKDEEKPNEGKASEEEAIEGMKIGRKKKKGKKGKLGNDYLVDTTNNLEEVKKLEELEKVKGVVNKEKEAPCELAINIDEQKEAITHRHKKKKKSKKEAEKLS